MVAYKKLTICLLRHLSEESNLHTAMSHENSHFYFPTLTNRLRATPGGIVQTGPLS